jgi:putative transposase
MQIYRRNLVHGGTYFFTVNLLDRSSRRLVDEVAALRAAVVTACKRLPFHIDAWVVLPEHLHCVLTLPPGDADYPARWRMIKGGFSSRVAGPEAVSASRAQKAERGIWQRRYWEHTVRDEQDYAAHVDYVHFNPVRHGYVARVCDWRHSTFHRSVRRGLYPADWGREPAIRDAGEHDSEDE